GTGSGNTFTDTIATFGAGATRTVTVVAMIASNVSNNTTVTDTASVNSNTADNNLANNTATFNTLVGTQADLAVTKTSTATAVAGQTYSFTISATNNGPSDALNVTVTDQLPSQVTFQGATTSQGSGSVNGSNLLTLSFGTIASGQNATAVITVLVAASAPN